LILRETEYGNVFLTRRILSLTPETAFQFKGKYRTYPPACLAALQKKQKNKKKKNNKRRKKQEVEISSKNQ
jgi:hypothetical protein